mmetsp:Transcript_46915/g.116941  ORF Transcript_46915/g.116941 Transcript_46915/m.116941 type:complete len:240 (-) Transcript_46915:3547-4266(-)
MCSTSSCSSWPSWRSSTCTALCVSWRTTPCSSPTATTPSRRTTTRRTPHYRTSRRGSANSRRTSSSARRPSPCTRCWPRTSRKPWAHATWRTTGRRLRPRQGLVCGRRCWSSAAGAPRSSSTRCTSTATSRRGTRARPCRLVRGRISLPLRRRYRGASGTRTGCCSLTSPTSAMRCRICMTAPPRLAGAVRCRASRIGTWRPNCRASSPNTNSKAKTCWLRCRRLSRRSSTRPQRPLSV